MEKYTLKSLDAGDDSLNAERKGLRNIGGEIDAHQHFWLYDRERFNWITEEMAVIKKHFLPEDLRPLLSKNGIGGCVAVQADQTEAETNFLLRLADENKMIRGIVGWVDLRSKSVKERLANYHQFPKIVGFRHVLQDEKPEFMLQPDFLRGIRTLREFNFTYDLLVFPQHLEAALKLVKLFPDQPFVIDHIAKPPIRTGLIKDWERGIRNIARCPNVYCKISGMVTEADFKRWTPADFTPYLDVVTEAFGINRIMYGSDWPVCQVAASYEQVLGIVKTYFSSFSPEEQVLFFGGNVSRFYRLT
jgi:L-fuconolactonase